MSFDFGTTKKLTFGDESIEIRTVCSVAVLNQSIDLSIEMDLVRVRYQMALQAFKNKEAYDPNDLKNSNTANEINAKLIALWVTKWSIPEPITTDSILALPANVFMELLKEVGAAIRAMRGVDPQSPLAKPLPDSSSA